jgi:hypothetical protein
MQVKTIKKIISKKMIDWLETIPNEKLRSDVKKISSYQEVVSHHCFKDYQLTTTTYTFRTWMF